MIPIELKRLANDDEEETGLHITNIDYRSDNIIISFSFYGESNVDNSKIIEQWTVEAVDNRKTNISFDYGGFIDIKADHPLLWEFTGIQCSLYYTGWCNDAPKLFFDLYTAHKQIFGHTQCFNIHFHIEKTYPMLSAYSNGLLTTGPKRLMNEYTKCLQKNGLDYNIIGEYPAKYWDGKNYIVEEEGLKVLFLGQTFVVVKDFIFKKRAETLHINQYA